MKCTPAGDGAHGVRTAAFNLPNDDRVVHEKGSKRVMLKNIQEAKFETILKPIAGRVLAAVRPGATSASIRSSCISSRTNSATASARTRSRSTAAPPRRARN